MRTLHETAANCDFHELWAQAHSSIRNFAKPCSLRRLQGGLWKLKVECLWQTHGASGGPSLGQPSHTRKQVKSSLDLGADRSPIFPRSDFLDRPERPHRKRDASALYYRSSPQNLWGFRRLTHAPREADSICPKPTSSIRKKRTEMPLSSTTQRSHSAQVLQAVSASFIACKRAGLVRTSAVLR